MVWFGGGGGGGEYFRYSEDKFVILFLESMLLVCIYSAFHICTYNIILDFCLVNNDHTLKVCYCAHAYYI